MPWPESVGLLLALSEGRPSQALRWGLRGLRASLEAALQEAPDRGLCFRAQPQPRGLPRSAVFLNFFRNRVLLLERLDLDLEDYLRWRRSPGPSGSRQAARKAFDKHPGAGGGPRARAPWVDEYQPLAVRLECGEWFVRLVLAFLNALRDKFLTPWDRALPARRLLFFRRARAALLARDRPILPKDLGAAGPSAPPSAPAPSLNLREILAETERRVLQEALEQTGWNRTRGARLLGISRRQLFDKIQQYGLQR